MILVIALIQAIAPGWVYFEACGFEVPDEGEIESAMMQRAPNIAGFWIKKQTVAGVINWKTQRGKACTSIYLIGADHAVHVIGNTDEVMKKLRQ